MKAPTWILPLICLGLTVVLSGTATRSVSAEQPPTVPPTPWTGLDTIASAMQMERSPSRLQGDLERLTAAYQSGGPVGLARQAQIEGIPLQDGKVLLVVEGDVATLVAELASLGGEIDSVAGDRLSLLAPVPALPDMAALAGVRVLRRPLPFISLEEPGPTRPPAPEARTLAGSITSEGVPVLNANDWHAAGQTGQGVKVAVIDTGFYNWTGLQASGDLPANTVCVNHSTLSDCGNLSADQKHGAACGELVNDLAPGVDTLYLYAFDDEADIAVIVDEMIAAGVQVATMSYAWLNGEPYDGSGFVSEQVNRARDEGDLFWAVAAGNQRTRHWEGFYTDGNQDGWHDFSDADQDPYTILNYYDDTIHAISGRFVAALTWNDWPGSDQDYDLFLYRQQNGEWVEHASSIDIQDGDDAPRELVYRSNLPSGNYALAIHGLKQTGPEEYLELMTFWKDQDDRYRFEESSVLEPATADGAVAVAAFAATTPAILEDFSAHGPRNPLGGGPYDPGACGTAPSAACKPDFSGPDIVSTVSYYPYYFRGTSAAAPQVAGAAALVQGANLALSANEIYTVLRDRAAEPGTVQALATMAPGSATQDPGWGWGRIYLGDPPGGTAVQLTDFRAESVGAAIVLQWRTAVEIDLTGFNLHRRELPGGIPVMPNEELIPSQPDGAPAGAEYTWADDKVTRGRRYEYRLEAVTGAGESRWYGPVAALAEVKEQHLVRFPMLVRGGR